MPINYIDIEPKKRSKSPFKKKWLKYLAIFCAVFVVLISILAIYSIPKANALVKNIKTTSSQISDIQKDIENQDITQTKDDLLKLEKQLKKTKDSLKAFGFVRFMPILDGYYSDADHLINAGIQATEAGEIVVDTISPFGDILGIEGTNNKLKAEEKLKVLVTQVLPQLSEKTAKIEKYVHKIEDEINHIDENRYPPFLVINGINLNKSIVQSKEILEKSNEVFPLLKNGAKVLPGLLGYQKEKTYLLWFQNDTELRPTGGFITAYGIARIKNGELLDIESDDIYQLDKRFYNPEPPPDFIRKYLGMSIFAIRDANISPDLKVSAEKFESFYKQIPGLPAVDGIITVDTEFVRKFMKITGPVTIAKYNETFSAEPHPVYKIPDVIYKLELYAEKLLRRQNERTRKGIVGDLMDEILHKLFEAPSDKFPEIFDTFIASAESKNLQFYFHDKDAQKVVEDLNFAGRIVDYDGDYLHINNSNFGGLKGNLYTKLRVEQNIIIASDGQVTKKVTAVIRNTEKADGWLNYIYRNFMRVYVPLGSDLLAKNVQSDFEEKEEFDKTVWSSFSQTMPLGFSDSSYTYKLPFKVKKGSEYKMLIQKQGGTTDPHMIIRVNGKKLFEFDLEKDTEIKFKI